MHQYSNFKATCVYMPKALLVHETTVYETESHTYWNTPKLRSASSLILSIKKKKKRGGGE